MVPRENKSNTLCKILEGQTKNIMVFLKVAYEDKKKLSYLMITSNNSYYY